MTRKPYYKLTIGNKPRSSVDMHFKVGRVRVEVDDALAGADRLLLHLCGTEDGPPSWGGVCRKVLAFLDSGHAGAPARLTEPPDRPLRDEVARLDAARGPTTPSPGQR